MSLEAFSRACGVARALPRGGSCADFCLLAGASCAKIVGTLILVGPWEEPHVCVLSDGGSVKYSAPHQKKKKKCRLLRLLITFLTEQGVLGGFGPITWSLPGSDPEGAQEGLSINCRKTTRVYVLVP